jgi:hypothetical protein
MESSTPPGQSPQQTIVLLGNSAPLVQITRKLDDDSVERVAVPAEHLKQSTTRVEMWPGFDDPEFVSRTTSTDNDRMLAMIHRSLSDEHKVYAVGVSEVEQLFGNHSGNSKPDWVSSNDEKFAEALGSHFGCQVMPHEPTMLLTNGGRDLIHAASFGTSAQPAAANYIALTANATAPAATDTTLTAEIATGGGGLIRAQATYAHTAGTNTTTLTKTFTANGSDALPVTVAKIGIFNAATVGTMTFETLLNATATLSAVGDNVTITETITGG